MNDLRGNRPVSGYAQAQQPVQQQAPVTKPVAAKDGGKRSSRSMMGIWNAVLLASITLVLAGLVAFLVVGNEDNRATEASLIDTSKYQAVFMASEDPQNLSRTYFGKLLEVDAETYVLQDVFVALEGATSQDADAQKTAVLDKIGCGPIQGPVETIYLKKNNVAFWVNLRDDSKLSRSIKQYKEQFPKPIECDENGVNKNAPASNNNSGANGAAGTNQAGSGSNGGANE